MRIAIVGPVYPYRGGIAHFTTLMARAFNNSGHQTKVISFRRQYPGFLYPGKSDKDPSRQPLQIEAEYILDPIYPWTWLHAANAIAAFKPDLVVIQWWTTFWGIPFAFLCGRLKRFEIDPIYQIHNVLPHEQRIWDPLIARLALKQGKAFIAQTPKEEERLRSLFPEAKIVICPLPVYSAFFEAKQSKAEARKILDIPPKACVLLFFGIVRPYKGLSYLLEALGLLRHRGINPCLIIAGEFWEAKKVYLEQVDKLKISDQVRMYDRYIPNEELVTLFSAADVLVAPYIGGTQSGAAEMAVGFGLPMIISENVANGMPENKLNNTQVVPPGKVDALADAIRNFMQDSGKKVSDIQPVQDDWDRLVDTIAHMTE